MSFYLSPPDGIVPYHKLEEYGVKRLRFLLRLLECQNESEVEDVLQDASVVDQSDCLIADTTKDLVSHHILRLLLGGCAETSSFFCQSERALFKLRIEKLVREEWIDLFQSLEKSTASNNGQHNSAMKGLSCIVNSLKESFPSWSHLAEDLLNEKSKVSLLLPYHLVLQLVASRDVHLNKGLATVPVNQLRTVLVEQFERLMWTAVGQAKIARLSAISDERIKRLASVLKHIYRSEVTATSHLPTRNHSPLRLAELWSSSVLFPPCMQRLTNILREHHRLKHHDRIQLTLFLKEVGLPVHDALLLWKHQYSEPVASEACGRWQGNERRYIYSIRHLYGLEGGRVNYKAHSCSYLQDKSVSSCNAGGCPFVLSDATALSSLLIEAGVSLEDVPDLPGFIEGRDYSRACHSYLVYQLKRMTKASYPSSHADTDQQHINNLLTPKAATPDKRLFNQCSTAQVPSHDGKPATPDKCLFDQCSTAQVPSHDGKPATPDKRLFDQCSTAQVPSHDGVISIFQVDPCNESNSVNSKDNGEFNNNTRYLMAKLQEISKDDQLTQYASRLPAGLTKPHFKFYHEVEWTTQVAKKQVINYKYVHCPTKGVGYNHYSHNSVSVPRGSADASAHLLDNSCLSLIDSPPFQISQNMRCLAYGDPVQSESHSFDIRDEPLMEPNQRCSSKVVSRMPGDSPPTHATSPIIGDAVVINSESSLETKAEHFHKFRHKKPSEYFWYCKKVL